MVSSDKIKEAIGYLNFDDIPTMKELNTRYRKMALMKHPDKNGGSDLAKEDYQNLQNFYREIRNYIVENKRNDNDEE